MPNPCKFNSKMNNYEKAKEEGIKETVDKLWGSLITKEGFEFHLSSFAEKIKEGRDRDILSWHKLPIKKQADGEIGPIICDCCGGVLFRIRGKFPKEDRRIICPTCAIEILEDIYSNLNTETSQQKNEMPNM